MATKLKIVDEVADVVPAPEASKFDLAPTRNTHSGWTAERQRKFIEHLSLTGSVGEAAALAGVTSRSAYRLRNKAGAEDFPALGCGSFAIGYSARIAFDRALHASTIASVRCRDSRARA